MEKKNRLVRKTVSYLLVIAALVLVGYNSVYFRKLDEVKASSSVSQFDPVAYASTYLNKRLVSSIEKALEINQLISLVKTDPAGAFKSHSHALGIGNIRFFLVKGVGKIRSVDENHVSVLTGSDTSRRLIRIATEYIFGNAIRDASGLIDINEFSNTMDFNNVSAEINKMIRSEILPPFKAKATKGDSVEFVGAIELNQEHVSLENIEVVPVRLVVMSDE